MMANLLDLLSDKDKKSLMEKGARLKMQEARTINKPKKKRLPNWKPMSEEDMKTSEVHKAPNKVFIKRQYNTAVKRQYTFVFKKKTYIKSREDKAMYVAAGFPIFDE